MERLTVDLRGVGASVKKDTRGLLTAVVHYVIVDFDVVAPFRGDNTWGRVHEKSNPKRMSAGESTGRVIKILRLLQTKCQLVPNYRLQFCTVPPRRWGFPKLFRFQRHDNGPVVTRGLPTSHILDRTAGTLVRTVVDVRVNFVPGDGQVVGVVVGVEAVLVIVVHLVVGPHAALVAVGVHAVVHVVDVRVEYVAVDVCTVENLRIALVFAEAADLPGQAVGFRVFVA